MDTQNQNNENLGGEIKREGLNKLKYFLFGIALLLVLAGIFGIVYSVRAVKNLSDAPIVLKVAEVLNLSVAKVNGDAVSYASYMDDVNTLKKFYNNAPAGSVPNFSDNDISDQALSRLIVNSIMKNFAREFKIAVTEDDISDVKSKLFDQYGTEEAVEAELMGQYGWNIDTYIKKIIRPMLLEQKVSEAFASGEAGSDIDGYGGREEVNASHILFRVEEGDDDLEIKANAEKVLERAKSGEDFASLASEFGSDSTKDNGGNLGWFGKGVMVPEFEGAIFSLEPGQVGGELVKTEFGYHIVKLESKRDSRDFSKFLDDELKEANIELVVNVHDPFEEFRALSGE